MSEELALRPASAADVRALSELERDANLVALAHVFPAADHPFPLEQVAARWAETVADTRVTVEVLDGDGGLVAYVAHDERLLRHLAVRPTAWGRGLGRLLVEHAVSRMLPEPRLWCLAENHRARSLYERLGWRPTGTEQRAVWSPHPVEVELSLPAGQTPRMRSSVAASRATTAVPSSSRMIGR